MGDFLLGAMGFWYGLPVLEGERLVGILTVTDLLRALQGLLEGASES